ncbi:single-stranded DNA-binding protein [Actinomycetaceae bacterium L2_0104]
MANEPVITIVGNLTGDPELRYVSSGTPVASFTVASTPRSLNRQTNQWEDGEAMFVRCSVWREYAENVAESLTKGMRVVVTGRMTVRSYEYNGQQRTSIELQVDEIGPSLRYARAQVTRVQGSSQPSQAPQSAFSGSNSQNPGGFTTPAMNSPQNGAQDPAGNLGQSGLWGQPDPLPPF